MSKTVREHFEDVLDTWNIREYWEHGFKGQGIKVANFEYCYDGDHGQNVAETVKTYAPECELMIWPRIKEVSPMSDNGTSILFPEFAKWCIDNKVDIITSSLDWDADKEVEKEWIQKLYDAGIIFCNCAGNENSNISLEKGSRANRIDKGIVCVGAVMFNTSNKISKSTFSNYGTAVDVFGIGTGTIVVKDDFYYSWSGTSAATPFIAGLLATYKSYDKTLNSKNVMKLFEESHIKLTYNNIDYKIFILPKLVEKKEENMEGNKNEPSSWAKDAWEKAIKLGITDGTNPQCNITREQVIVILDRLGLIKK